MSTPAFSPRALLARLVKGGVDFVVIGGVAVFLHGYERATKDLDITYARDPANLEALAAVLAELEPRLRGAPEDMPFIADARTLRQMEILKLVTNEGELDLLAAPSGSPPYATLKKHSVLQETVDGIVYRACSLDDLLAMKRAAGRLRDLADIEELESE
ncbi:MAG: nucleotidyl transferase AbiEii/AbiGii toxin family protein [Thermoleophilaceae bacterium]|nr:nucleotidyl transferase AbiEii/AbiGii toxin family protein [Thermoleophilaceae bacterium]